MKHILLLSVIVIFHFFHSAAYTLPHADSYETRSTRAERFFTYKEWSSALAMYQLMLDERPDEVEPYYKAIVAGAMIGDSITQMNMLERTQQRGISLDSLFNGVRSVSFAINEAEAYNDFLMLVKSKQPWLKRRINIYLLNYYNFRNDADNIISTAKELLEQTPENTDYIKYMAKAYIELGNIDEALKCYKHILHINNYDYDALLALGNHYALLLLDPTYCSPTVKMPHENLAALAQSYLYDAYNINPTPYVKKLLDKVSNTVNP